MPSFSYIAGIVYVSQMATASGRDERRGEETGRSSAICCIVFHGFSSTSFNHWTHSHHLNDVDWILDWNSTLVVSSCSMSLIRKPILHVIYFIRIENTKRSFIFDIVFFSLFDSFSFFLIFFFCFCSIISCQENSSSSSSLPQTLFICSCKCEFECGWKISD